MPVSQRTIARLKRYKESENMMYKMYRELAVYFIMLTIIWSISYSNRDPKAFLIKDTIVKTILEDTEGSLAVEGFNNVSRSMLTICYLHFTFKETNGLLTN